MSYTTIAEMRIALQKKMGWTDDEIQHDELIRALSKPEARRDQVYEYIREKQRLAAVLRGDNNE